MRGTQDKQNVMFSYVSQESRIPQDHPMRLLREIIDPIMEKLSPQFNAIYADAGRPSIPPEYLLRAMIVQILYTIRSERLLMEQLNYNLLFRWFVGLSMDTEVWDHSVFSKNRDRLLEADIATEFLSEVVATAKRLHLLSNEHFTVDGTLIEAWASQKSFQKKDKPRPQKKDDPGNPTVNFHGEERSNTTHESTTDPEARLYRKSRGQEAKLCFMGHVVMDNLHGLVVNTDYTQADGYAERDTATTLLKETKGDRKSHMTAGADKLYDTAGFVERMKALGITPHVAQNNAHRSSAIDGRTTRHPGYLVSQIRRKIVEEIFGWIKTIGLMRKVRHRGLDRGGWMFTFTTAVYDLLRIRNIQMRRA